METMFKKYILLISILLLELLWCLNNINVSYLKYYNHDSDQLINSVLNFVESIGRIHKHNDENLVILARCLTKNNLVRSQNENNIPESNSQLMDKSKNKLRRSTSLVQVNNREENIDNQPSTSTQRTIDRVPIPIPRKRLPTSSETQVTEYNDQRRKTQGVKQLSSVQETDDTLLVEEDESNSNLDSEHINENKLYDENKEKQYLTEIKESCYDTNSDVFDTYVMKNLIVAVNAYNGIDEKHEDALEERQPNKERIFNSIWIYLLANEKNFMEGIRIMMNSQDKFFDTLLLYGLIGVKAPEFYVEVELYDNFLDTTFEKTIKHMEVISTIDESCVILSVDMRKSHDKISPENTDNLASFRICGPGSFTPQSTQKYLDKLKDLRFGINDSNNYYIKSKKKIMKHKNTVESVIIAKPFNTMQKFIKSFYPAEIKHSKGNDDWHVHLHRLPTTSIISIKIVIHPIEASSEVNVELPCWQCIIFPSLKHHMKLFFRSIRSDLRRTEFVFTLHKVNAQLFSENINRINIDLINQCIYSVVNYAKYVMWNYVNDLLSAKNLSLEKLMSIDKLNRPSEETNSTSAAIAISNLYFKDAYLIMFAEKNNVIPLINFKEHCAVPWIFQINNYYMIDYSILLHS